MNNAMTEAHAQARKTMQQEAARLKHWDCYTPRYESYRECFAFHLKCIYAERRNVGKQAYAFTVQEPKYLQRGSLRHHGL
jgi:D-alanyl-D-alanine dipeptidase